MWPARLEDTFKFTDFPLCPLVQTFPVTLQLCPFFPVFTPGLNKYFFHITWKNFAANNLSRVPPSLQSHPKGCRLPEKFSFGNETEKGQHSVHIPHPVFTVSQQGTRSLNVSSGLGGLGTSEHRRLEPRGV